jgi:hypothetical protein
MKLFQNQYNRLDMYSNFPLVGKMLLPFIDSDLLYTIKSLVLSTETHPERDFRVCGCGLYTTIIIKSPNVPFGINFS